VVHTTKRDGNTNDRVCLSGKALILCKESSIGESAGAGWLDCREKNYEVRELCVCGKNILRRSGIVVDIQRRVMVSYNTLAPNGVIVLHSLSHQLS
jgi:hypothetical protein